MVGRRGPAIALSLLLLAAAGATGAAQESTARERRLLLFFSLESGGRYAEAAQRLLYESLLARLASDEAPFSVFEWGSEEAPPGDAARTEAALERDCDAWAAVELLGSEESPGYRLRSFDLVTRKQVADQTVTRDTALRPRDLERRFWDEAASTLSQSFQAVEFNTRVTFEGAPGTVVAGLPGRPIVLGEAGRAETVLPNPSLYKVRATHRLYRPSSVTFAVKDAPLTVDLRQERAPRWMYEGGLATLNFMTAAGGVYFLPNYAFAKIGLTTYVLGFSFAGGGEDSLFVSEPLTDLRLQVGSYLSRPDAAIRWYGAAGGVLRVMHGQGHFGLEPVAPLAFQLTLGLESKPWKAASVFFEAAPTAYFSRDPDLLAASYPESYNFTGSVREWGVMDFYSYRAGVRVHR